MREVDWITAFPNKMKVPKFMEKKKKWSGQSGQGKRKKNSHSWQGGKKGRRL